MPHLSPLLKLIFFLSFPLSTYGSSLATQPPRVPLGRHDSTGRTEQTLCFLGPAEFLSFSCPEDRGRGGAKDTA